MVPLVSGRQGSVSHVKMPVQVSYSPVTATVVEKSVVGVGQPPDTAIAPGKEAFTFPLHSGVFNPGGYRERTIPGQLGGYGHILEYQ